jgi:hypothetical protein
MTFSPMQVVEAVCWHRCVSEHCKIVDAYKDISREGNENMTTGVAPTALALPAGAPKEENADAEEALPGAPPVEAGALPDSGSPTVRNT